MNASDYIDQQLGQPVEVSASDYIDQQLGQQSNPLLPVTQNNLHADMLAKANQAMATNGTSPTAGLPAQLLGYAANVEQAVPFMHEVGSALAAVPSLAKGTEAYSEKYNQLEQAQQAMREASKQNQPVLETPSYMPDITPTGVGELGAGLALTPLMPGPRTLPKSIAQAMKQGGGWGSLYGGTYGAAQGDPFDTSEGSALTRLENTGIGAGIGGVLGAPFGALGYGVGNALTKKTTEAPEEIKILSDYMNMDKTNPSNLYNTIQQNPNLTLGDISGPNMQTLLEGRAQSPGSAMSDAVDMLQKRNMEAPSRIDNLINNNIATPDYFAQRDANLGQLGSKQVSDAYQAAYQNGPRINDSQINSLVDRLNSTSVGSRILKNAEDTASLAGNTLGPVDANGKRTAFSSYGLDTIKQSADQIIRSSAAQGNFDKYTTQGKNLIDVVNQITARHDQLNPLYSKARQTYSNPASLVNALDLGYSDIWGQNSHQAIQSFNNLSGPEQDAAMSGIARRVSENLKTQAGDKYVPGAANTAKSFLDNPRNMEILQKVLPQDKLDSFTEGLKQESNMQSFGNKILTNSATARRLAAQEDFQKRTASAAENKVLPAAKYLANLKPFDQPASIFGITPKSVDQWAQGMSANNRDKIGSAIVQKMMSNNTGANLNTVSSLDQYMFEKQMQDMMRQKMFGNGLMTTGIPRFGAQAIPFSLAPPNQ